MRWSNGRWSSACCSRDGQLLLREHAIRARRRRRQELAVRRDVLIERHLIGAVAPPPEAVAVARLVDGDAVDPGAEARLAAEAMDGAEDAEEDFLREVERLVAVAQQVDRQLDDHALVLGDQLGTGRLVAGAQRCTSAASRPPTSVQVDDARLLH